MSKIYNGNVNFGGIFHPTGATPLDDRLTVKSKSDLLTDEYKSKSHPGMVVSVTDDACQYYLDWDGVSEITDENWIKNGGGDNSTISKYGIPVMTDEMRTAAINDVKSGFTETSDYIRVVDDADLSSLSGETTNNTITSVNGTYLDIMMQTIRALQAEVTKLKNTLEYGLNSYNNENTAMSAVNKTYDKLATDEPLWSLEEGYLSEVTSKNFNSTLDPYHTFETLGGDDDSIDASVEGQLTITGNAQFSDQNKTLFNLTDAKVMVYLVTTGKKIDVNLVNADDPSMTDTMTVKLDTLIPQTVNKYAITFIVSRKTKVNNTYKGFNYVYVSVLNFENNQKLVEGYLKSDGTLGFNDGDLTATSTRVDLDPDKRYTIANLKFNNLVLSRMKFYTKYQEFTEETISSIPNDDDYKYKVAHITIRSVRNEDMLTRISQQLQNNELIWNEGARTLHIKSNGNIYNIGAISNNNNNNNNEEDIMTAQEIYNSLRKMGIIVDATFNEQGGVVSFNNIRLNDIADFTLINEDTDKRYTFSVDGEGNLVGKYKSMRTIQKQLTTKGVFTTNEDGSINESVLDAPTTLNDKDANGNPRRNLRGFSALYLKGGDPNGTGNYESKSDRLRISSFYAPIETDTAHGCSHSFVELENTSDVDIPLTGIYLHFFNAYEKKEYHLALDGVIKKGSTYLIRGAQHAKLDDASTFIKVATFDQEWYYNKELVSFEQKEVITKNKYTVVSIDGDSTKNNGTETGKTYLAQTDGKSLFVVDGNPVEKTDANIATYGMSGTNVIGYTTSKIVDEDNSPVVDAYRFCLTYGLPELKYTDKLVENAKQYLQSGAKNYNMFPLNGTSVASLAYSKFPNLIINPRFIDGISLSTFSTLAATLNNWYINGDSGSGVTITPNSMYRIMFALDPAKQAYQGWTTVDGSRVRYNKTTDIFVVNLDKEFIGFPFSNEIARIDRYTPKASFENKNVMTDKTQLDFNKPNMTTCSFGIDVYKTRCFNWISCGIFDEYVWVRKAGATKWERFQSYVKDDVATKNSGEMSRKGFNKNLLNSAYARITNRFPGNDVLFTSHKCIIDIVPTHVSEPTEYEYVVGRPDKDMNPDAEHTSSVQTFTLYPDSYEGRVYQITDQQGFHWIEYQVWAASAEKLNKVITEECDAINTQADADAISYPTLEARKLLRETWRKWQDGDSAVRAQYETEPVNPVEHVFPILINTGDMTQSGARINEWLDYYNGGVSLFNHMEQINCVGNNDLCPANVNVLGTGNDPEKINSQFFHYFYCFEVENNMDLVVRAHDDLAEDKFIPSTYYIKTTGMEYIILNSEITENTCANWYKLINKVTEADNTVTSTNINVYTGIEVKANGSYVIPQVNDVNIFKPIYETLYGWLNANALDVDKRKVVVCCHEMPLTVITKASLTKAKAGYLAATRNHPDGGTTRLGSNMNQISSVETRGTYWCSRLLEQFGCKLVIGGHKHTYALSYPVKEKYTWTYTSDTTVEGITKDQVYDSGVKTKPMSSTLEDEANGTYVINWLLSDETVLQSYYNNTTTKHPLNTTKTPYIPANLYSLYGAAAYEAAKKGDIFRCCTPVALDASETDYYEGFVSYSMCQATGYKLKSNKELPATSQLFSKLIPMTTHKDDGTDSPSGEQLFPMYSVIEVGDKDLNILMVRICGIFAADRKDTFTQSSYGKTPANVKLQYLVTTASAGKENMYGVWVAEKPTTISTDKYLYIRYK